jgi:hypothetical protein
VKTTLLLIVGSLVATIAFSQNRKKIQRSWIKTTVTNLTGTEPQLETDTLYIRYTFDAPNLYISFYPAWDTYKQEWSISGNQLTIGFTTYTIETLTDTSLTIAQAGFRRMEFLSEEYLSSKDENLIPLGAFNGKPLCLANKFITPRYSKHTSFMYMLQEGLDRNNVMQPDNLLITFVVTEEGRIENVQLIKGISAGYDQTVIERIQQTSKNWKPALFKGKPVQAQLLYEVKYLPSLAPGSPNRRPAKMD